jgi:hypothetical protein
MTGMPRHQFVGKNPISRDYLRRYASFMPERLNTGQLTESIGGQHLSLAVAAHLARTQLVPDSSKVYDGQHLSEMLNVVALALARTAPLFTSDPRTNVPQPVSAADLEGAAVKDSARVLVLSDGRMFAGATIRRSDLRQAIALLKTIGLRYFVPELAAAVETPTPSPKVETQRNITEELCARFAEVDEMLKPPFIPAQLERAKSALVWMARHAPQGQVANLAMQLMSTLVGSAATDDMPGGYRLALARLRAALDERAKYEERS